MWPHRRARGRRGCPRIVRVAVEVASGPDARRAVFGVGGNLVGAIVTLTICVHAFEKPFLGRDAYIGKTVISWDCVCVWTFDTPTAAPAADQPTSLSAPLGRPALTLPAPYPSVHTSDTTNTNPA